MRLTIFNGHNPKFDEVQLAEFEIYSTDGVNVGGSKSINYTRDAAELVWYSSEAATGGKWTAANLHDGAKSRPDGVWSFAGPPPLIIPDKSQILDVTTHSRCRRTASSGRSPRESGRSCVSSARTRANG